MKILLKKYGTEDDSLRMHCNTENDISYLDYKKPIFRNDNILFIKKNS